MPKLRLMPDRSRLAYQAGICEAGTGVPPSPESAVVTPWSTLFSASPFWGRILAD
ncbi:MAG: hypothetical protein R2909_08275 [Gemmatimonadales bacterium]